MYEAVFEPFSVAFARAAFEAIGIGADQRVLDVGAGCGGAALDLAARGCRVTAVLRLTKAQIKDMSAGDTPKAPPSEAAPAAPAKAAPPVKG